MQKNLTTYQILQKKLISHSIISLVMLFSEREDHQAWDISKPIINNLNYFLLLASTLQSIPMMQRYSISTLFISQLSGGETNNTYRIKTKDAQDLVLRTSKKNDATDETKRKIESYNVKITEQLGLNLAILSYNAISGTQVTRFLQDSYQMNEQLLTENLSEAISQLQTLHQAANKNIYFCNEVDIFERNRKLLSEVKTPWPNTLNETIKLLTPTLDEIEKLWSELPHKKTPSHLDPVPSNFLLIKKQNQPNQCRLIDFEYAGNVHGGDVVDIAYFCIHLPEIPTKEIVEIYLGNNNTQEFESHLTLIQPVLLFWLSSWYYANITETMNQNEIQNYLQCAEKYLHTAKRQIESLKFGDTLQRTRAQQATSNELRC